MTSTSDPVATTSFSELLRARTQPDHGSAEASPTLRQLADGTVSLDRLGLVLAQHLPVYRALEHTAAALADDPVVGPFLLDGLARTPALEHDVALLLGPGAPPPPSDGALAYAARIEATRAWPAGFVAHHYTRYLGDLSGGQHIGRALARAHPDLELRFYAFDEITSPAEARRAYRERLDAAPWDGAERERFIDEVHVAYDLTAGLLADLEGAPA